MRKKDLRRSPPRNFSLERPPLCSGQEADKALPCGLRAPAGITPSQCHLKGVKELSLLAAWIKIPKYTLNLTRIVILRKHSCQPFLFLSHSNSL